MTQIAILDDSWLKLLPNSVPQTLLSCSIHTEQLYLTNSVTNCKILLYTQCPDKPIKVNCHFEMANTEQGSLASTGHSLQTVYTDISLRT